MAMEYSRPFLDTELGKEAFSAGVSGGVGGLGQLIAGATTFDRGDARRLDFLNEQLRQGTGATQGARSGIQSQFAVQRGGQARSQQARSSNENAARAASGMFSGRDLFQAEMAAQDAELTSRMEEQQMLQEADREARMARRQEKQQLRALQRERRRQMLAGGAQMALSTALGFAIPGVERLINTRRAGKVAQAAKDTARRMSGRTPAMSTPAGDYSGVMRGRPGTAQPFNPLAVP